MARLVAVPARGAGCIDLQQGGGRECEGCRPREGCGLHRSMFTISIILSKLPAPRGVRIASMKFFAETCGYTLLSPRGVRVASSLCSMTSTSTTTSCRPREGCGLHQTWNNYWDSISKLPSPRGVRVASSEDCCCYRRFWLPSPRGVRVASQNKVM